MSQPAPRAWTAAEDRILLDLSADGVRRDEIAVRVGRSAPAVYERRKLLRRRAAIEAGVPLPSVRRRFSWQRNLPEVRAMLEAGQTGAEIARHFGLRANTVYNGLKRYGLDIDPAATRAARMAACVVMATRPDIRKRRSETQREKMRAPEMIEKYRAIMLARHRADPDLRIRSGVASQSPEAMEKRRLAQIKIWAARNTWLPEMFRDEYRHLIRSKGLSAAEAKAALLPDITKWLQTFEGKLWRVATGQARLVPNIRIGQPAPAQTSAYGEAMT